MRPASNVRAYALSALASGCVGLAFVASTWLLNPFPTGASCYTADGYAAIKAHADANGVLAFLALACAAVGGTVCLVGAVKAKGHRVAFALGLLPFVGIALVSLALLLVSAFYCQN